MIASGRMLGPNVRVHLKMLDIEPCINSLRGCAMELEDCAYPLLDRVGYGFDPKEMLSDCDIVICLGGFPRKAWNGKKRITRKKC